MSETTSTAVAVSTPVETIAATRGDVQQSDDPSADSGRDAWHRARRIVALRKRADKTFLRTGREIFIFDAKKQYRALGHPTLASWFADPEVSIGRTWGYAVKEYHELFVARFEIPLPDLYDVGIKKLGHLAPYVNKKLIDVTNVDDWIATAATTSDGDLLKELHDAYPGVIAESPRRKMLAEQVNDYLETLLEEDGLDEAGFCDSCRDKAKKVMLYKRKWQARCERLERELEGLRRERE